MFWGDSPVVSTGGVGCDVVFGDGCESVSRCGCAAMLPLAAGDVEWVAL